MTAHDIQIAVARADVALLSVWAHIRAAPLVLALAAGLWWAAWIKYRRQRRSRE